MITGGLIKKDFENEKVIIIGGGASLSDFDFNLLNKHACIAINTAFLKHRRSDVVFFTDATFYRQWSGLFHKSEAKDIYCTLNVDDERLTTIRTSQKAFSKSRNCLGAIGNSGLKAINLAYLMGAKEIVLLGFDANPSGKMNWHSETQFAHNRTTNPASASTKAIEAARIIKKAMESADIDTDMVINANPESYIDAFRKMDREEALA